VIRTVGLLRAGHLPPGLLVIFERPFSYPATAIAVYVLSDVFVLY